MKSFKNISLGLLLLSLFLAACDYTDYDAVVPDTDNKAPWDVTMTIAEFKETFLEKKQENIGLEGNPLFKYYTVEDTKNVVISGRVISSDIAGNVYKYMVVQDTITGDAIKISIDASGVSGVYPEGQVVVVKCNTMTIGDYADMIQLGRVTYDNKKGYIVGRMPKVLADDQIIAVGMPDKSKIIVKEMTIKEILDSDVSVQGRLVKINNCYFTQHGADRNKPTPKPLPIGERIFAPSTGGIGYPQSREVKDGTGSIFVSTSEYARFADVKIPAEDKVGTITAIVGYYNDKDVTPDPTKIYYQLTLRSLADLSEGFFN